MYMNQIKPFYLCSNYPFCKWEGSTNRTVKCPVCGSETCSVPCVETGCSIFFKLGRNLRVLNTVGPTKGQQGHVEDADVDELVHFIFKSWPAVADEFRKLYGFNTLL